MAIHHHTPKQRKTIQAARKRKTVKKSKRKIGNGTTYRKFLSSLSHTMIVGWRVKAGGPRDYRTRLTLFARTLNQHGVADGVTPPHPEAA